MTREFITSDTNPRAAIVRALITAIFLWTGSSSATGAPLALSLDDALARVRTRSPSVTLAMQEEKEAEATRTGAAIALPTNPRLYAEARPAITGAQPWQLGLAANVEVPFEVSGAAGARLKEADKRTAKAKSDTDLIRFETYYAVWQLYVSAQLAGDRRRVVDEAVTVLAQTKDAAEARARLGAASDIDLATSEAELAEFRALAEEASALEEHAKLALKHALDLEDDADLSLTTSVHDIERDTKPTTVSEVPALAALQRQVELLDQTDDRLRREALPKIGVVAGVDAAPVSPIFGQVGLAIELPVAHRNQGPRAVARSQRDTQILRVSLKARELKRELASRRVSFDRRLATIALLDEQAIPAAKRNLALVTSGWKQGRFDVFQLTSAARQFHRLRLTRVDAVESTWRERIALAKAQGELR